MRTEPGVNIKKKSNFIVEEEDFLCLVNYSKHQLLFFPKKRNNNKIGEGVTSPTAHGKHFKFFSVVGLFHLVRAKRKKRKKLPRYMSQCLSQLGSRRNTLWT